MISLPSIGSASRSDITVLDQWLPPQQDHTRLLIFYQRNCSSCRQQFAQLPCLKKIQDLEILLVGAGRARLHLRKKALEHQLPYRLVSFSEAKKLGVSGTPATLISSGKDWIHKQGVTSCQEVKEFLSS